MSKTNYSKAVKTATPEPQRKAAKAKRSEAVANAVDSCLARLRKAESVRSLRERTTVGVYSLRVGDGLFGVPYFALSDTLAVLAQKEILPQSNVWRVGSFCLHDGKIVACRPTLVLDKE